MKSQAGHGSQPDPFQKEYHSESLKTKSMKNSIRKPILSVILILITVLAYSQNREERKVSSFSGISLSIAADLYLSQGSPQQVILQASEEDLAKIKTEVKNEHLNIKCDSYRSRVRNVEIWITTPDIEELHLSGSGKIIAETSIQSEEMEMRVSGSGRIKIAELEADELGASISGSGSIHLEGTADEMEVNISGSGSMMAEGLQVDECDVKISGSGSCQVDATGELNAAISGSGRVTYFSDPQIDASVSGSGKIRRGEK